MKHRLFTIVFCILLLCSGCGRQTPTEPTASGTAELWVLTEKTYWDGMNDQAKTLIKEFEAEMDGISVRLEIMPTDQEERSIYLESLRAQIMAGKGPDIYLLPTGDVLSLDYPTESVRVEPLFQDVSLSMSNQLFYDISAFYDSDGELGKEALITEVMDAGKQGDARYVLPLRFDMPVICVDTEELGASPLDVQALQSDYTDLLRTVLSRNDGIWISGVSYESGLGFFTDPIDYENKEVLLSPAELAQHLENEVLVRIKRQAPLSNVLISDYIQLDTMMERTAYPMQTTNLFHAMSYTAIEKSLERELTVIPLHNAEGLVTATVSYYGAVGTSCEDPELAYQLLRKFLLEESQWEQNRSEKKGSREATQTYGLVGPGWPVRAVGSVELVWISHRKQNKTVFSEKDGQIERKSKVTHLVMDDSDMPVLQVKIDQVTFPVPSLDRQLQQLRSQLKNDHTSTGQADYLSAAEDFLWEVQLHLAEG